MLILTFISVGIIILLAVALRQNPQGASNALLGKPAMEFSAQNIREPEAQIVLSSFKGKPVVLNFWASWCVSCREEARELEAFHREYGDIIHVVGIAVQDELKTAIEFADSFQKTYKLGLDSTGRINVDYGVVGVPETFYIDEKGLIQHKEVGPVSKATLEAYYAKYLPKKS